MKLLRRVGAVLLGCLLAVVAAELAVRTFVPQPLVTADLRYVEHPTIGFRIEPDLLVPGRFPARINALGLRGDEVPAARSGVERVLVLGDSFTYGAGVLTEQAFPQRLDALARDGGRRFINAGTPSYGTLRELAWLETFGDEIDPDELLLAVFAGNDLTDNLDQSNPRIFDGQIVAAGLADASDAELRRKLWLRKSHLWRLVRARLDGTSDAPEPAPTQGGGDAPDLSDAELERILEQRRDWFASQQSDRLAIYLPEEFQTPRIGEAYAETRRGLDGILAWCRERSCPLRIVVIPDVMQVEPDLLDRSLASIGRNREEGDFTRPQRTIVEWGAANGVEVLDLLPEFERVTRESGASQYLDFDSHWNAAGHALAARAIAARFYAD